MTITTKPLHQIAEEYPSAVTIFERFEIDLCAWGDKALGETCASLKLSTDQVLEKLEQLCLPEGAVRDAASLSLTQLIQRIVRVHHRRVRQDLPALVRMAGRLASTHGNKVETYATIAREVETLHSDMLAHIEKEEQVLFPVIAEMEEKSGGFYAAGCACFSSVRQPIARMKQEHETANRTMNLLRQHTNAFHPPEKACSTQRALYGGLRNFETDLQEHMRLEDELLFPRVINLETELQGRSQS